MGTRAIPLQPTYTMAQDQRNAKARARGLQDNENHAAITLETQDAPANVESVIWVYNIWPKDWVIEAPPLFPRFYIPSCPKGQKVAFNILPRYVKLPLNRIGTTEMYYKTEDGRKSATTLLNPQAFPGTDWQSQLQKWDTGDQFGNNLNAMGVWWSLTEPDDPKLEEEIKQFRARAMRTIDELIQIAETHFAANQRNLITPLMHFAMDYSGKQAPWHQTSQHMVSCPNCGAMVLDGIAYHKNDFGERCIIDRARCIELGIIPAPAVPAPAPVQASNEEPKQEEVEEEQEAVAVAAPTPSPVKKGKKKAG